MSDALYPWHKGGKEIRYLHLLEGLPQHDMDVVVYTMKWWSETPEALTLESGSLNYTSISRCVPIYHGSRRSVFQAVVFAASTFRLVRRKFDVIEADHMPYLQLLPLRIVAWIKRVPLVVTWHEVWGRDGWRSYLGHLGFVANFLERVCIHLPNRIVAVSTGTAEKLEAMGANPNRVFVVPNALDLEALLVNVPNATAPELLFVGRLLEHKNANLAVEATRLLAARGYDVHLGIVGVGPEEVRLRALVTELQLDAQVIFFSTIDSQDDLWSLIHGSRVLLAPSVREGFGLVVAESLALGTPAICALHTENESSKLVSPATGSLVEAFSSSAIADAAEHWLNDDSTRASRVATFVAEHEELTASAMAMSYAEILRCALDT